MNNSYPLLAKATVIRQPDADLHSEPTGLASITEIYRGYFTDIVTNGSLALSTGAGSISRAYRSPHPDFPSLLAYGVKIKRGAGQINGTLTVEYRGLDPSLSYPPPPVYTVEVTTGNEPLSTHPKWATAIAGTAAAPLNGARFVDANGLYNPAPAGQTGTFDPTSATFSDWLAKDPATSKPGIFVGIEDYLAAGVVYKKRYTSLIPPVDLEEVGYFDDPDGPVPNLPDGYDWWYQGETSEDNAGIYNIEGSWKAVPTGPAAKIIYNP